MTEKKYLDYDGLQAIAQKVNARLKTETTMPDSPSNGAIRLYIGDTDGDFIKGHVYQAHVEGEGESKVTSWSDITPLPSAPIVAKGTIKFKDLDSLENVKVGWMYNIEDNFVTDERFAKPGVEEKASSNVYCIEIDSEGTKKWDVFAAPETVKVEAHYNEKSKNAQSGKAVAEALKPFIKTVATMPEKVSNGETVAYLGESDQYVKGHLYEAEVTNGDWRQLTWNISPRKDYLWVDNEDNIYCSYNTQQGGQHYVLKGDTWEQKTWKGHTTFNGSNIWTDGDNLYSSSGINQYVLDKTTDTWEEKHWNGLTSFNAENIWKDGENIYASISRTEHYILNKASSTWNPTDWTNPAGNFSGKNVWTDGDNIYCSTGRYQYKLNKTTNAWEECQWQGISSTVLDYFNGTCIWTDGNNIYYNLRTEHFVLEKGTNNWKSSGSDEFITSGADIFTIENTVYYMNSYNNKPYILTKEVSWLDLTAASNPTKAITREDVDSLIE